MTERICKNCSQWENGEDGINCKDNKALKPDGTDSCMLWGYFNKNERLLDGEGRIHQLLRRTSV